MLALSRLTKNDPDNQEQLIQAGGGPELLRIARDEASDAPLAIETRELAKATLGDINADLGSEAAQALDAQLEAQVGDVENRSATLQQQADAALLDGDIDAEECCRRMVALG